MPLISAFTKLFKPSNPSPLFFLHIPKTAGTSLEQLLAKHIAEEEICPPHHMQEILDFTPEKLAKYALIRGHFIHALLNRLPSNTKAITILRDPISRTISHLRHMRESDNWLSKQLPIADMTLDDMLQQPLIKQFVRDHQLRRFAVDIDLEKFHDQPSIVLHPPTELDETHLTLGKERLRNFTFVGITEHFAASATLLSHTFNWPEEQAIPASNTAEFRGSKSAESQLSKDSLKLIKELTLLDQAFYDSANALFKERCAKAGIPL